MAELYDALGTPLYALALRVCGQTAAAELAVETVLREVWAQRATIPTDLRRLVPRLFARCRLLAMSSRVSAGGAS